MGGGRTAYHSIRHSGKTGACAHARWDDDACAHHARGALFLDEPAPAQRSSGLLGCVPCHTHMQLPAMHGMAVAPSHALLLPATHSYCPFPRTWCAQRSGVHAPHPVSPGRSAVPRWQNGTSPRALPPRPPLPPPRPSYPHLDVRLPELAFPHQPVEAHRGYERIELR